MNAGDLYTGDKTVWTLLREAALYRLGTIKADDGYWKTVAQVLDIMPASTAGFSGMPAVVYITGKTDASIHDVAAYQEWLNFSIYAALKGNDPEDQEKMLCDLVMLFGRNWAMQGSDGLETAFECEYTGHEFTGRFHDKVQCGVRVEFRVRLFFRQTDPTQN